MAPSWLDGSRGQEPFGLVYVAFFLFLFSRFFDFHDPSKFQGIPTIAFSFKFNSCFFITIYFICNNLSNWIFFSISSSINIYFFICQIWFQFFLLLFVLFKIIFKIELFFAISSFFNFFPIRFDLHCFDCYFFSLVDFLNGYFSSCSSFNIKLVNNWAYWLNPNLEFCRLWIWEISSSLRFSYGFNCLIFVNLDFFYFHPLTFI